ncbi:MCE family protein [Rhodococcus sp. PAMC28707]|uniref:MCE family protein n=1 Tax=unclassified Rhodococcus (in: high G+C Gram-positive bacteria) TaxID=192944 RepID=UPI00109DE6B9|nr:MULTISPECIES: MCE family protein [unclassified Rhodococcus (in: high G+C Gram-positive bacteria)]QCB49640.1 MCE family protein [Rhodococcus sp. PAMC28705]QCB58669.1 MCE family protein [Rhodococcus sp. PAMC28707]
MISRQVRLQLIALLVVTSVGTTFVGAKYVRIDNLLGFGQYRVNAEFEDSGGIFTNAEVTYRGVPVGTVGKLSLTHNGIDAELLLDSNGPNIPNSAKAVVANRSMVGEQYVDLQPTSEDGPYLDDGSTIGLENTETPVPVEKVLAGVDQLVKTVPLKNLTTVVRELGNALNGRGDDLQMLADTLGSLSENANEALPETLSLIRDSRTVLDTQSAQASAIGQFSTGLDSVAAQLRSNDPDIRQLIETGTAAGDQVGALIAEGGPALTADLANINSVTELTGLKAVALRPLLIFLPSLAAGAGTIVPNDGTAHLGLVLETNNPPPCTIGYEGSQAVLDEEKAKDPNFDITQGSYPLNLQANCATPQGSVTGVRSANRIVFADPRTPQPWDRKPKVDPDKLNLNPIASQLSPLVGATAK